MDLGPPFHLGASGYHISEFQSVDHVLHVESHTEGWRVRTTVDSRVWSVGLARELIVTSTGDTEIRFRISNLGTTHLTKLEVMVLLTLHAQEGYLYLPTEVAIVKGEVRHQEFPVTSDFAGPLPEPWLACDRGGAITGLIWPERAAHFFDSDPGQRQPLVSLRIPCGHVVPGEIRSLAPVHLVFSCSSWRELRTVAAQRTGCALLPLALRDNLVSMTVVPECLASTESTATFRVEAQDVRLAARTCHLNVSAADGAVVDQVATTLTLANRETIAIPVRMSVPAPGLWQVAAELRGQFTSSLAKGYLWYLQDGVVQITQDVEGPHQTWELDNGVFRCVAAPRFGGSLIRMELAHHPGNLLRSYFPRAKRLLGHHRWYGGLVPFVSLPGRPMHEDLGEVAPPEVKRVRRRGPGGVCWVGLGIRFHLTEAPPFWVEYLTTPLSRIIAVRCGLDAASFRGSVSVNLNAHVAAPSGWDASIMYLRNGDVRERAVSTDQAVSIRLGSGPWVAAGWVSGPYVALVPLSGVDAAVISSMEGPRLVTDFSLSQQSTEATAFLGLADTRTEAEFYRCLASLSGQGHWE